MALFGLKKTEEKKDKAKAEKAPASKAVAKSTSKAVAVAVTVQPGASHASVILRPHVTEKSGVASQAGVYTFQVAPGANKNSIARAIISLYKVTPVKITVTNLPAKNVFMRGKRGVVAGVRKAVVTVKKGDKIDFV